MIAAVVMLSQCWAAAAAENSEGLAKGRENKPPVLVVNIPLQTFPQDNYGNKGYHLVNLSKFFRDDSDAGNLTYSVVFATDPAHICGTVDGQFLSFTTPTPDWYGQEKFRVRATDAGGLWTESNNFTVRVASGPTGPPPPPEIHVTRGEEYIFNLTPHIMDVDSKVDQIVVKTNSTYITVEGLLLHLLYTSDIAGEDVKIIVNDTIDEYIMSLKVVVDPKRYWQIMPDLPWEIVMSEYSTYFDDLSKYANGNDTLLGKLAWNVTGIQGGEPPKLESVAVQDGILRIVAAPHRYGLCNFTLNAYQSDEKIYTCNISVTVMPVSMEDLVPRIIETTVSEHRQVSIRLLFEGFPEAVVFWTNTTMFTISDDGWVNFTPVQKDVGSWRIFYRVTESADSSDHASREFRLTVLNVNDPPGNVTILKPRDGQNFTVGEKMEFECTATDIDGDRLHYLWHSNREGVIGGAGAFSKSNLPIGKHHIYVNVSDGEYSINSPAITITVGAKPETLVVGPDYPVIGVAILMLCVLAAAMGTALYLSNRKR